MQQFFDPFDCCLFPVLQFLDKQSDFANLGQNLVSEKGCVCVWFSQQNNFVVHPTVCPNSWKFQQTWKSGPCWSVWTLQRGSTWNHPREHLCCLIKTPPKRFLKIPTGKDEPWCMGPECGVVDEFISPGISERKHCLQFRVQVQHSEQHLKRETPSRRCFTCTCDLYGHLRYQNLFLFSFFFHFYDFFQCILGACQG